MVFVCSVAGGHNNLKESDLKVVAPPVSKKICSTQTYCKAKLVTYQFRVFYDYVGQQIYFNSLFTFSTCAIC